MQTHNPPIQTGSKPNQSLFHSFKQSLSFPEKLSNLLLLLARAGLLLCLVASISLVLRSSFTSQTHRFILPSRTQTAVHDPVKNSTSPTNISHIVFGIGASVQTWKDRSLYTNLWWNRNQNRGFAWLDSKPGETGNPVPHKVSEWCFGSGYSCRSAAVRIARIVVESYKLGLENVRWFVMGDDDTVFFTENLVTVLAKYDHTQMYYIGGNSESVEQDQMHSYGMAFGGGGFAISYPLAAQLVKVMDGCLHRYSFFYGSDQRVWACIAELGVPLTTERGFHQFDIRGHPYGILAAHPLAPLVSLHHLDHVEPLFPNQTRVDSLNLLMQAYRVDSSRILQQTVCYDRSKEWSISVAWGYTVQIYPFMVTATDMQIPFQTFKTWRSSSDGPFDFNTRPVSSDPCWRPVVYFLKQVQEVDTRGTKTTYERFVVKEEKECERNDYARVMAVKQVTVSSMKMDNQLWMKAPQRQCCEIMDKWGDNDHIWVRLRKCKKSETITT
ncbi:uncharacterized protein LOC105435737 [Cucumis sativus]|uniref:uncharacterized protein LOC105435737 n=1 Tax=Cucumis sativus TaxID=3659 RepID=UPI0005EC22E7|nr:uncharacterized protein LOC105435737 [Cucumis sativus]KGN45740.2 hypothetical protein Csa_005656 [Cucumis sativus]